MRPQDYHYFIARKATNTSTSFTAYTDKSTGVLMQVFKGRKEKIGKELIDVPHRWKFDSAHRSIRVHKNDRSTIPTMVYDEKLEKEVPMFIKSVDFLRGYPECKGSPNGDDSGWSFSELKEREDAITAVDASKIQLKALNAAMNLGINDLKEMSALYGYFDTDDAMQKKYLLEVAGADPSKFLEFFEAPERSAKALLKKATSLGVVKTKGALHVWEAETIGVDEAMAVSRLMKDTDLQEALRNAIRPKV